MLGEGEESVTSRPAVVVIGGGVIGLSAAYHLRRADPTARVTVLERHRVGAAASGASAAGVRVLGRDRAERALALASLARWPELDRELEAATGYRRGGGLRVLLDEADLQAAEASVAEQRVDGVPVELVGSAEAHALAPGLTEACLGGLACSIDGQAEAELTVAAFAAAARRLGARVLEGVEAFSLSVEAGRVTGVVLADGERLAAEVVIVAAGAWTAPLLAPLGVDLPLRARALQMLLTEPAPADLRGVVPALSPVVGCVGRLLSLKQLADGAFLIGGGWPATIVDEPANRWELRDDSVEGSLAVARYVYPSLARLPLARGWAGVEAFAPDELPYLGPVSGVAGLLVAAGFSGHGFALSPAVGEVLAGLALGGPARESDWAGLRADRTPLAAD
jgi:sarcosine oxidase subunit beta